MSTHPSAETPLRALPARRVDGVDVVRETGQAWLDGSEDVLHERMTTSGLPLDSLSDELFATATSWPERYHLSPSRANAIRALDLPADACVLEIGAGCGAITRYLGETCALVDALEPTFARARVAAARTAELPGVRVFNAEVEDLPDEQVYDLVVVVGVLEYVGGGGDEEAPYVAFLDRLRRTLRTGGRLVLAIENELGVKYLAGAPEDHSGKVFHSVEGYPVDGPARTFSRRRLQRLLGESGFATTHVLGAFPDYKLTRIVLDGTLLERAPSLAVRAPHFPSPDWVQPRPVLLDEQKLWQELVDAGVGLDFANSFVVVASVGEPTSSLWPQGRLARYFSMQRRRHFQVVKTVASDADGVTVTSERLASGEADGLAVLPYSEPWLDGESLVERAVAAPETLDDVVRDWGRVVRARLAEAAPGEGVAFDVLPHNVLYRDGVPGLIDDEWRSTGMTPRDAILRGALVLVRDLLDVAGPERWGASDWRELVARVADVAGEPVDGDGIERAILLEADLQATVGGAATGTPQHARTVDVVERELRRRLASASHGRRPVPVWESEAEAFDDAVATRDLLFATGKQLDEANARRSELEDELGRANARIVYVTKHPVRVFAGRVRSRVRRALQRG